MSDDFDPIVEDATEYGQATGSDYPESEDRRSAKRPAPEWKTDPRSPIQPDGFDQIAWHEYMSSGGIPAPPWFTVDPNALTPAQAWEAAGFLEAPVMPDGGFTILSDLHDSLRRDGITTADIDDSLWHDAMETKINGMNAEEAEIAQRFQVIAQLRYADWRRRREKFETAYIYGLARPLRLVLDKIEDIFYTRV